MNISMQLTFDGLVRALRWKALSVGEAITVQQASGSDDTGIRTTRNAGGGKHEEWRGSIAEGSV
ncbi:hypothetical protein F9K94_22270 [Brucella tritici]|jgi:hypothetical protein|uniref:Uncharacterized protein n=2 Tax=Brucella/Ochrobactrum group TaxID=2826938 RepID=A0A7V7VQW1_9HYPH|nr:hypothetical protein F9K94_22270 [Brucella tritici]KXO74342.1 hypothetical protein AYJ56_12435 [Brucella anthropi]